MDKLKVNLMGMRIGRLLVIKYLGKINNQIKWLCQCDCGNTCTPGGQGLRNGTSTSCGCYHRERSIKHGHVIGGHTREYQIWANIKDRCFNEKHKHFDKYGGRGITMYEGWVHSFDAFTKYIGPRPSPKHSVDRYPNNDGNYEPGNVRWATNEEQMRNTRNTHFLELNGRRMCVLDWAAETGIGRTTINQRLKRGWSVEKTLTTSSNAKYNRWKYETS